jgi:hypothetical protein
MLFPFLLEHRWVCYVWQLYDNEIIVFDPSSSYVPDVDVDNSHSHVSNVLEKVVRTIAEEYFIGWDND